MSWGPLNGQKGGAFVTITGHPSASTHCCVCTDIPLEYTVFDIQVSLPQRSALTTQFVCVTVVRLAAGGGMTDGTAPGGVTDGRYSAKAQWSVTALVGSSGSSVFCVSDTTVVLCADL